MAEAVIKLVKDNASNNQRSAAKKAKLLRVAEACRELEGDTYDLANMARIAADIVEDAIASDHSEITHNKDFYYIPRDQADSLMFAVVPRHETHRLRLRPCAQFLPARSCAAV
jgi:hypothetical protein